MHVFRDGQAGEHVFGLRHETDAAGDKLVGTQVGDVLALQQQLSGVDMHQTEQRLEQCGLVSAIRTDDADDFALMQGKGGTVEDVHAGNVPGDQVDRVQQGLALGFSHVDLRTGQTVRAPTLNVRFSRIGQLGTKIPLMNVRFSRIGHRDHRIPRLNVRFWRIGQTCRIGDACDVAHLRPPSNLQARNRHPGPHWHAHPDRRRSQPGRSSRSSADLRQRSCLPPSR